MNNRYLKKWLTALLSTALIVANVLFTGTQVSSAEIQTDTLVVNENPSDEGISDTVDVVGEGEFVNAMDGLALMASSDDIASGTYWDITWVIDANGKLTVEGTGDFSPYTQYDKDTRAPWYSSRDAIISAEVKVTGMTNASYMFYDCNNLTSLDLSSFDTSNVTDMCGMFYRCNNLTSLDLSNFDTSNVTNMYSMFSRCSSLTSLDLSNFDTSSVTSMHCMFSGSFNLTNVDLSNFDTSNVTDAHDMFFGCLNLTSVDLSNFDTSNVTSMRAMFHDCEKLTSLDLSNFDTSNVTSMSEMFDGCDKLINLDLSNFDTSNVTNMSLMFEGCKELASLDLSSFNLKNIEYMFSLDTLNNLATIYTPNNLSHSIGLPINSGDIWYRSDGSTVTELPRNLSYSVALGRNYIPEENVSPDATFYFANNSEYYVYEEDLTVSLWGDFEAIQKGNVNEEADAIVWESSDPLIAEINKVVYVPYPGNIYTDANAYTSATFILYMDCYKPGTVTVTGTSADGRTISKTISVEPKLIAGESTRITDSSNVMLCKVELAEKTDEELGYLQTFLKSLEVEIVKGTKWDLEPVCLTGDGFVGLYTYVNADSVSSSIAFEIISPGGQVVKVDVQNEAVVKSTNTVVYFKGDDKENLTFDYRIDSCLEKGATEYNPDLAYMLVALATSAYQNEGSDFTLLKDAASGTFPDNPLVITESLRNLGFNAENGDVREFNYYSNAADENYLNDTTAFTLATKEMSDGTTLIAIVVRGSYGDIKKLTSDWRSNVNFQNWGVGLHEGFNTAANEIIKELNAFKDDKSISDDNVTYVITGHSRGAAVANLVAKKLIDSGTSSSNVYDYNFACPDSGRDFASNWNSNGKYDSIYNINNVRDIVGVIPGNLFNSSLNTNTIPSLNMPNIIFWGKYGHTYFFAENWNNVQETMIGGFDQHAATLYLDQMSKKQLTGLFKSWEQARATLAANIMRETYVKNGKVFGVFCPVDFEIIDKDGVKIAEVVNGQSQYYSESFGDVAIVTAGDQSLVYINGKNNYFVKFTGYDTGEMTYYVGDAVLGSEYGKEIVYANVPISPGKTMISILDNDEQSDKVTLVLFDEELNPVKQIDCNGAEQGLSDALKEEYSNLPLGRTVKQYNITYNLDGGQEAGNPTTYTKDTATFTLINPTKTGYTFIGWTGSNGNTPEVTVTIAQGMTGDLFYTANWKNDSSGTNDGTANSNESGTDNNININTNTNDNANANITATNSSARDAVPKTGDVANIAIPLIIICILIIGVAYVQKNSNSN